MDAILLECQENMLAAQFGKKIEKQELDARPVDKYLDRLCVSIDGEMLVCLHQKWSIDHRYRGCWNKEIYDSVRRLFRSYLL
jgi:hypothetical protein